MNVKELFNTIVQLNAGDQLNPDLKSGFLKEIRECQWDQIYGELMGLEPDGYEMSEFRDRVLRILKDKIENIQQMINLLVYWPQSSSWEIGSRFDQLIDQLTAMNLEEQGKLIDEVLTFDSEKAKVQDFLRNLGPAK